MMIWTRKSKQWCENWILFWSSWMSSISIAKTQYTSDFFTFEKYTSCFRDRIPLFSFFSKIISFWVKFSSCHNRLLFVFDLFDSVLICDIFLNILRHHAASTVNWKISKTSILRCRICFFQNSFHSVFIYIRVIIACYLSSWISTPFSLSEYFKASCRSNSLMLPLRTHFFVPS